MKLKSSFTVGCFAVLLAFAVRAQTDEPKVMEKMVGKWEATNGPIKGAIFDFAKDGAVKLTVKVGDATMELTGKFKVASADIIELTLQDKTHKVKYTFEKDVLNLTDPEGNVIKFVKQK